MTSVEAKKGANGEAIAETNRITNAVANTEAKIKVKESPQKPSEVDQEKLSKLNQEGKRDSEKTFYDAPKAANS